MSIMGAKKGLMLTAGLFVLALLVVKPASAQDADEVLAKLKGLSASEREKVLVAAAKKEGKVVYYASGNVRDNQEIVRGFNKRYPFIEVEYSGGGGSKVVNRAHTEFLAKHHVMDIVNANAFRMPLLLNSGVLGPYQSVHLPNLTEELVHSKSLVSPLYTTAIVIGYNTMQVQPRQVPKSFLDLLKPQWKGKKMALDTEAHSWFMGILGIMGQKEALEYCRKLAAQDLIRRRGHTLLSQLLLVGEFSLQIEGYHHTVYGLKEKGAPIDYVVTDPVIMRPPSAVGLAKKAPHPHAAALFIDYLLSPEGGQAVFADQLRWPANKKAVSKFKIGDAKIWAPDLEEWLPKQKEVLQMFDEVFGGQAR